MHRPFFTFLLLVLLAAATLAPARADDQAQASSTEARLRDALRNTMLQLRDAQNQVVTLQASQAQSDQDNTSLKAQVEDLKTQLDAATNLIAVEKKASNKTIADLKSSNADLVKLIVNTLSAQITALSKPGSSDRTALDTAVADMKTRNPDLAKWFDQFDADIQLWMTAYNQFVQLAKDKEEARAALAAQVILMQRTIDDRESKNIDLYNTGNEILDRYKGFSLGDAITAKEPFVGITRAKLETLVQDYKDKLLDHVITSALTIKKTPSPTSVKTNPAGPSYAPSAAGGEASSGSTVP